MFCPCIFYTKRNKKLIIILRSLQNAQKNSNNPAEIAPIQGESKTEVLSQFQVDLTPPLELTEQGANILQNYTDPTTLAAAGVYATGVVGAFTVNKFLRNPDNKHLIKETVKLAKKNKALAVAGAGAAGVVSYLIASIPQEKTPSLFKSTKRYFDNEVAKGKPLIDEYTTLKTMGRFSKSENEQLKQTLENACSNREELAWARVQLRAIEASSRERNDGRLICDEQAEQQLISLMEETKEKLLPLNP